MASTSEQLRARDWDSYIGQEDLKNRLNVLIQRAITLKKPLEHMLFVSKPGQGKTSLAEIVAKKRFDKFMSLTMPVDSNVLEDVVLEFRGVLLLDEIHRSSKKDQEQLLKLLESGYYPTRGGLQIQNDHLTIIAASTREELLDPAVVDRFSFKPSFADYTDEHMALILKGMLRRTTTVVDEWDYCEVADDLPYISEKTLMALARAAGGRPRTAQDLAIAIEALFLMNGGQAKHDDLYDSPRVTTEEVLYQAELDHDGLTGDHVKYLEALYKLGGVAGLTKITSVMTLHPRTVNDLEKLLFDRGFIRYHPSQGRQLTMTGRAKTGHP